MNWPHPSVQFKKGSWKNIVQEQNNWGTAWTEKYDIKLSLSDIARSTLSFYLDPRSYGNESRGRICAIILVPSQWCLITCCWSINSHEGFWTGSACKRANKYGKGLASWRWLSFANQLPWKLKKTKSPGVLVGVD